jgi:hypothetical protein
MILESGKRQVERQAAKTKIAGSIWGGYVWSQHVASQRGSDHRRVHSQQAESEVCEANGSCAHTNRFQGQCRKTSEGS